MDQQQRIAFIEQYGCEYFSPQDLQSQSVEIARLVADWRGVPEEFSSGWGTHCSPALFLTLSAILSDSTRLERILNKERSFSATIRAVLQSRIFHRDDLFEIGGRFLDFVDPSQDRCRDAAFSVEQSLSLDSFLGQCQRSGVGDRDNSLSASPEQGHLPGDAVVVFANGVFEIGSGIAKTLCCGPTTLRELSRILGDQPEEIAQAVAYRDQQSALAAVELFACARNLLRSGGILAVSNIIAPDIVPTDAQLRWLGFCEKNAVFSAYSNSEPHAVRTCVRLFQAVQPLCSSELSAVAPRLSFPNNNPQDSSRKRVWVWENNRIRGEWRAC